MTNETPFSNETSSTIETTSNRMLFKDDTSLKLKHENMKLKGEVSILRQNILVLEKENYNLKIDKSNLSKSSIINSKKQELELLKLQYKINENKPSAYNKQNTNTSIDLKWALMHSNTDLNFQLEPFEYTRLKFLKDFFYNEFYQFETGKIIKFLNEIDDYKKWLDFFCLFCCKLDVFNSFFDLIFINNHFEDIKIELLETLPLDWIINYKNGDILSVIKEFVKMFYHKMTIFIYNITKERPFIINFLLDAEIFTKMIKNENHESNLLLNEICKNGGLNLINRYNFHFLNNDQLKYLYKDDYIDFL
ncbi:hypothetical protein NAPIS_ORF01074 [Vairimorpha apis BRL 01]|uniref:Uncharacterized protein n=1 Tax=Vairimorpha apis BRL 01 TaxID=1037528 RepID=T0MDK7_9MICR|nr:hypothetical protein NAPIS_ORF01074 [Vairimorpha apis BRL 01]